MENIKKFYDALSNDKAMQERAAALNKKGEKSDKAAAKAAIVAFAKAEGYDFNLDDLESYAAPLADDLMEAVAGGIIFGAAPGDGGIIIFNEKDGDQDEWVNQAETGPDGIFT